jgi:hypothetical protein
VKSGMMPRGESALAHAISAARRQPVDPAAVARVQAQVLAAAGSTPAPVTPAGPLSWLRARWTYLGGGTLLLLGALQLFPGEPTPARPQLSPAEIESSAHVTAPQDQSQAPVVEPAPVTAPSIALPPAAPTTADPPPRRSARPAMPATRPQVEPLRALDPEAELALLRRALSALPTRPTHALELVEEHARLYPDGAFAQEREAIAIDASLALQRTAAAEARVRRFLSAYPRSPHAPRMRALLGPQQRALPPTQEQAPMQRRRENP